MTGRVWIRLLIVILAATASRRIFPLLASSWTDCIPSSASVSRQPGPKHQGVVPSRRYHESRRVDWIKELTCPPFTRHLERTGPENATALGERASLSSLRQPRYLSAFMNSTSQESIPPPLPCSLERDHVYVC